MASTEANGITIEYEQHGSGSPLVLIMGLGGQLIDWPENFVDRLAQHFQVTCFDNRDSGLSSLMPGHAPSRNEIVKAQLKAAATRRQSDVGYRLSDMADDAIGLMDNLGIEAAHIVGMSMGGMIAQTVAIGHPNRVLSLTSIMSNTGDSVRGGIAPKLMAKVARRPAPTIDTAVDSGVELMRMISGTDFNESETRDQIKRGVERSFRPEGTARQMAAIGASSNRTEALANVSAPTLVIHGLADPLVRPSGGIATAKAVPGSRLLMFADMAHDLPRSRRDEMVEAIVANAKRTL